MGRLTARWRRGTGPREGAQPDTPEHPEQPPDLSRQMPLGPLGAEAHTVSRLLYERLGEGDIAEIERLAKDSPQLQDPPLGVPDVAVKRQLALHYGLWLGVPSIEAKTGLRSHEPPAEVHAMARGPMATAGGLYESDMIADALRGTGVELGRLTSGLDFGCSSGRVVRVLAAAYPNVRWYACDPNAISIEWAREQIPDVEFFVNGSAPPLPLETGSLGLAFAISIWSHFEPALGLRWFGEMHRVIRPGGCLVFTTHGLTSVAYYAANGERPVQQCEEIREALYKRGWWYHPEFGAEGDWGVVNPAWGTAFVSPEWVLAELCPRWRVLDFAAGRNAWNQDVYVLERADLPT